MTARPVTRRTQAERRATTRAALADAAVDSLVELGWAATTIEEVCRRAGVTRGAFNHHYSGLAALHADALRALYDEMRPSRALPPSMTMRQLVDHTWAAIRQLRFKAVIEAWLAMANDPELRSEIGPVVAEFAKLVDPDELAPALVRTKERRAFVLTARETMLGLALGRATRSGRQLPHEDLVLRHLRDEARRYDRN